MKIFSEMVKIFDKENEFIESKNSYFETHECMGSPKKVQMDYEVVSDKSGDTIVFGKCDTCNKVFYNVH